MRRRRGLQIQRQSPTVKVEIDLQWLIVSMARASSDFDTSGLVLLGVLPNQFICHAMLPAKIRSSQRDIETSSWKTARPLYLLALSAFSPASHKYSCELANQL